MNDFFSAPSRQLTVSPVGLHTKYRFIYTNSTDVKAIGYKCLGFDFDLANVIVPSTGSEM